LSGVPVGGTERLRLLASTPPASHRFSHFAACALILDGGDECGMNLA
jgi:hypothetical protein